jgi:hypothetical protein
MNRLKNYRTDFVNLIIAFNSYTTVILNDISYSNFVAVCVDNLKLWPPVQGT